MKIKEIFKKNGILLLIALFSAFGLMVLSYLTILDYADSNEDKAS